MKFHEKRHFSQKYIFSDALEEDYRPQLRAILPGVLTIWQKMSQIPDGR